MKEEERESVRERGRSSARDLKRNQYGRVRYRLSKESRGRRCQVMVERNFTREDDNHRVIDNKHQEDPWIEVGGRRKAWRQTKTEQGAGSRRQREIYVYPTIGKHRPQSWRSKRT